MNYRHSYHAGNFADVVKHVILIRLIKSFLVKDTGFQVLDIHAGIGLYDLACDETQKSREYEHGVAKLIPAMLDTESETIATYLTIIKHYNSSLHLSYYPGSPMITDQLLRPQDKLILCELHPHDHKLLKLQCHQSDNDIAIHHMDGYLALKAFLPPKLKRGLVLIDPPFETPNEFERVTQGITTVLPRWRNGVFMVWLPLKNTYNVNKFYAALKTLSLTYTTIEFTLPALKIANQLSACSIVIINPPWLVADDLAQTILPLLAQALDAQWTIKTMHANK
ncbi:MAG: 23S rRNA (adenine(2030)-N(6))-methyltransferase RlmJ [Gammaproteobacteria bacterium]